MDPLSDVLSLLKPRSYISGGFEVGGDMAIQFPKHQGIKCYAVLAGQCWLSVEGVPDPGAPHGGGLFPFAAWAAFLPRNRSVTHACRLPRASSSPEGGWRGLQREGAERYIVGGHFLLSGSHADMLLGLCRPSCISGKSRIRRRCAGHWNA